MKLWFYAIAGWFLDNLSIPHSYWRRIGGIKAAQTRARNNAVVHVQEAAP